MTRQYKPLPLAITMGDAAGIGPEIIAKAYLQAPDDLQGTLVIGDVACLRRAVTQVLPSGQAVWPVVRLDSAAEALELPPRCIPVLQPGAPLPPVPMGQVSAAAGRFAGECVLHGAALALQGEVSALVTAPLHKEALHAGGAPFDQFPGHTEMLQAEAARFLGQTNLPVRMMLANEELRTVLVSIHVSLRQAIEAVTFDNVLQTLLITHASLSRVLGRAPRIAVAGLNPHAGEGGLFGTEELEIIAPAMDAARLQGCVVSGPWPPDTIFMRARKSSNAAASAASVIEAEFDVVLAMYHDQGLIPVKYLGVENGVNVTLGLPFVRTSPDHGTAFDIAGRGLADPASLLAALNMARQLAGV